MTKDIRVISGAENSEQNDDKTNNLDDVIQFPLLVLLSILLSSIQQIAVDDKIPWGWEWGLQHTGMRCQKLEHVQRTLWNDWLCFALFSIPLTRLGTGPRCQCYRRGIQGRWRVTSALNALSDHRLPRLQRVVLWSMLQATNGLVAQW